MSAWETAKPMNGSARRPYNGGGRRPQQRYAPRAQRPVAPAAVPPPPKPVKAKVTGQADLWQTLQTITDPKTGASKTTRGMRVPGGIVINTTTRAGTYAAEALVHIPGADIIKTNEGARIVARVEAMQ